MHHSPSLFFDILATEDEQKRDEKIRRASFEIKTAHFTPPANGKQLPYSVASSAAGSSPSPSPGDVTAVVAAGSTLQHDEWQQVAAADQVQQKQQQQQQQGDVGLGPQLVLSPQEVLGELLGDLFIHTSRLTMRELLGQGGFADVHAAELSDPLMPAFTEPVAVKRLRPDVLKSPDDLREFLTEANLLRKLQHRNIVRLRGVGAADLTDLVSMRESMFVVQEFMAGGDLKQSVMAAMAKPFDPPYTKQQAFTWAMQIAEAMHYLHSVCCPMIIHRDLKLDNVLLTGGNMHERVAKLADFGLHKRVRKMTSSGALVAWDQETTYHGGDFERSFYGGKLYLVKSAMSIASSTRGDDSIHNGSLTGGSCHGGGVYGGSVHGGSVHGISSLRKVTTAAQAAEGDSAYGDALHHQAAGGIGGLSGPTSNSTQQDVAMAAAAAAAATADGAVGRGSGRGSGSGSGSGAARLPPPPQADGPQPHDPSAASPFAASPLAAGLAPCGSVGCSDSAGSFQQQGSTAAAAAADAAKFTGDQQQHQLLQNALRAKSQGLMCKNEFVTRVLSMGPSSGPALQQGPLCPADSEVARTLVAVQALEGSVRAGSAYTTLTQPQQQQKQQQQQQQQQLVPPAAQPQKQPLPLQPLPPQQQQQQQQQRQRVSSASSRSRRGGWLSGKHSTELCPALLQELQQGQQGSRTFIEATQKVGSVMYMAPEVLTGHKYNEKIDVFSFGIILYELLGGVVIASRVAIQGEHEELLDYARQVAAGHREPLPSHWPQPVKALISSCWAQDPTKRPGFKQVLRELYALKQAGVDVQMEGMRPSGDYNPLTDCGCSIM